MAILKQGCCCSLRSCVQVLGWFSVVLSLGSFGLYWLAYNAVSGCEEVQDSRTTSLMDEDDGLAADTLTVVCHDFYSPIVAIWVFSGFWFISSILLLVGVYKESRYFLLPFLILHPVHFVVCTICELVLYSHLETPGTIALPFILVPRGLWVSLLIYCMLCVISHYQNLRGNADGNNFMHQRLTETPSLPGDQQPQLVYLPPAQLQQHPVPPYQPGTYSQQPYPPQPMPQQPYPQQPMPQQTYPPQPMPQQPYPQQPMPQQTYPPQPMPQQPYQPQPMPQQSNTPQPMPQQPYPPQVVPASSTISTNQC